MSINNQFRHQEYHREPPAENWRIVDPGQPMDPESAGFLAACMPTAGWFQRENIAAVFLVHGTLAGTDLTGLHREVGRIAPRFGDRMGVAWKQLVDMFAGDMGNYTQEFTQRMNECLNSGDASVYVRRFLWSSENHHLGRAEAALRLICELSALPDRTRIMLWGHSHAGNVFALVTNLLGSDIELRRKFLEATQGALVGTDPEMWYRAEALLTDRVDDLIEPDRLDIVTFGTPIRYGWECRGYGRLLHVINHRTLDDRWPHKVPFPPTANQISQAEAGDYFQQFFIAGTNFIPIYSPRQWRAESRLHALVQREVRSRDVWESLSQGRRVADDGLTLLVDYASSGDKAAASLSGHAVYTRLAWLPYHLDLMQRVWSTASQDERDSA